MYVFFSPKLERREATLWSIQHIVDDCQLRNTSGRLKGQPGCYRTMVTSQQLDQNTVTAGHHVSLYIDYTRWIHVVQATNQPLSSLNSKRESVITFDGSAYIPRDTGYSLRAPITSHQQPREGFLQTSGTFSNPHDAESGSLDSAAGRSIANTWTAGTRSITSHCSVALRWKWAWRALPACTSHVNHMWRHRRLRPAPLAHAQWVVYSVAGRRVYIYIYVCIVLVGC